MSTNQTNSSEVERLVGRLLDDCLTEPEQARLNELIETSPDARDEYVRAMGLHAAVSAVYPGSVYLDGLEDSEMLAGSLPTKRPSRSRRTWWLTAAALSVVAAFTAGFAVSDRQVAVDVVSSDAVISGHAVLRRAAGVSWPTGAAAFREGDVLPAGVLSLKSGAAEIDLFCGAGLIVEGPASLDIRSDWDVRLISGRLRAIVPPAARGFVVRAGDSDVVDLGTEFAVSMSDAGARVEVVDGEVKLRGGLRDGQHLFTGEVANLDGRGGDEEAVPLAAMSTRQDLEEQHRQQLDSVRDRWAAAEQTLVRDPGIVAYYDFPSGAATRRTPNLGGDASRDGQFIGLVGRRENRFESPDAAVNFAKPGSRVRVLLDGEFDALSMAAWVRIDRLGHLYNAIFMGDGYENGEPHWQIREDGQLMFSVMVDDSQDITVLDRTGSRSKDAGLHWVYRTEPVWDESRAGEWMHVAVVYDPAGGFVRQYVDGREVSSEAIRPKYRVDRLRIGPAEIGNWGQPFRETPWFSVRNLDGTVDDLAILSRPLSGEEIRMLYEDGAPPGHQPAR